jgi:hypothetical protein
MSLAAAVRCPEAIAEAVPAAGDRDACREDLDSRPGDQVPRVPAADGAYSPSAPYHCM